MNVKPQIFQATKQSILKNKSQFLQIQVSELSKRINLLKTQNQSLKQQIAHHKPKSDSLSYRDPTAAANKENITTNLCQTNHTDPDGNQTQIQGVKELEARLAGEQKLREMELGELEEEIRMLKQLWEQKQKMGKTGKNNNFETQRTKNSDTQSGQSIQVRKSCKFIQSKPQKMIISTESLNQSQIEPHETSHFMFNNSINSSFSHHQYLQQTAHPSPFDHEMEPKITSHQAHQLAKRKTMSLNLSSNSLNNSSNLAMGFKFGKKSMNKKLEEQDWKDPARPSSSVSISFPQQPTNEPMLAHSNSRTSVSILSNTGSSKSTMRRTQGSKSYAKIVTRLTCTGCHIEYRPNQYYSHIQHCRDYIKNKLLQEKQKIQDEINQTLNLSVSHL